MPRFAILTHDHPFAHWDFLLENGDSCRTWRLLNSPELPLSEIPAEELSDHRLLYLDYEGPVSGQRGIVTRWDVGTFEWYINRSDACEVRLAGLKWQGLVRLAHSAGTNWNVIRTI